MPPIADDDRHTVPAAALPPTRPRALTSPALAIRTTTVTLTDPVVGPFRATISLTDTDPYDTAAPALDRVSPDVATNARPTSDPALVLHPTLLDDPHAVPAAAVPPTLHRPLSDIAPISLANTVALTDPVDAPFPRTTLLTRSDSPA